MAPLIACQNIIYLGHCSALAESQPLLRSGVCLAWWRAGLVAKRAVISRISLQNKHPGQPRSLMSCHQNIYAGHCSALTESQPLSRGIRGVVTRAVKFTTH
jgi:hypothetical protein